MIRSDDKRIITLRTGVWLQEGIVFLAFFFFLLLQIHPVLMLELRPPVFFKDLGFLSDFMSTPGWLADWLAPFFLQFWFSDFVGALFLTLCLWTVAFLTKAWMQTLTDFRPIHTFHLIPAGLLLILLTRYDFSLSIALAMIINLGAVVLFLRWAPKRQIFRSAMSVAIAVILYWLTGGAFFVFAVLCGLDDLRSGSRIAGGAFLLLASAVLPFAASASIVLVPVQWAYLHNLIPADSIKLSIANYSLPAFYPLAMLGALFVKYLTSRKLFQKISGRTHRWHWAIGASLILGGTLGVAFKSDDSMVRLVLQVNKLVKEEQWESALRIVQKYPYLNPLLSCQTNLALSQTGRLLDTMFAYPQNKGTAGLLMNDTWCLAWPEEASTVCWKLGLVNESLHWAHEALEHKGATPSLLRRLGMAYMVKGEKRAASHFFLNLEKIPFCEQTADQLIHLNENPVELADDSVCRRIQMSMPNEDHISLGQTSAYELALLLKRNPRNTMAFEYLNAYFMLSGNLRGIRDYLAGFNILGYSKLPRHIQEALLVIAARIPKFDMNRLKNTIDPANYNRFVEYQTVLVGHKGNTASAQQTLQKRFGDTYWYYLMYGQLSSQQSETQHEYQ